MQVMSHPHTVAPSSVAPNFEVSANVVTLCSRLNNEKCTWFSLCSVKLYFSLNTDDYIFLYFFSQCSFGLGATKLWGDGATSPVSP